MKVLAFDTTAPRLTVGLADETTILGRWDADANRQRGNTLDALIALALSQAGWSRSQIDGIGLVTGPGSLTATRIGWATASGWAVATGVPVVGWTTPEVQWRWWMRPESDGKCRLTDGPPPEEPVICLIHHRGSEYYAYSLKSNGPEARPRVVIPGEWRLDESQTVWIVGPAMIASRDQWVASVPKNANLVAADDGLIGGDRLAIWAVESLKDGKMLDVERSPLDYGHPPDFKKAS